MLIEIIKENESVIYQGSIFKKGDVLKMDDAVAASLMKRGYVAAVKAETIAVEPDAEETAEENQIAGHLDREQLEEMTYQELKKLAADMGLDANGKKAELIERIVAETVYVDAEDCEMPDTSMPE